MPPLAALLYHPLTSPLTSPPRPPLPFPMPRPTLAMLSVSLAALFAGCALAPSAFAQDTTGISDDKLAAMVRQMDAADWAQREAARQSLADVMLSPLAALEEALAMAVDRNKQIELADRIGAITLPNLRKLETSLQDTSLSPEQMEALNTIAYKLFSRGPRGAMGVSFAGTRNATDGVIIGGPVAGFDSMRVFQPGDVLRRVGGLPITNDLEARVAIVSYDPLDRVEVEFARGGEVRTDLLMLGDFSKLQNSRALDESTMRRAWRLRVERLRKETRQAVPAPTTSLRYSNALQNERIEAGRQRSEQTGTLRASVTPLNVDGGGSSRVLTSRPDDDFALLADDESNPNRDSIALLTKQISRLESAITQVEAQLRDQNLNAFQRANLKQQLIQNQRMLENNREERRRLRALGVQQIGSDSAEAIEKEELAKPRKRDR